MIYLKIIIIIRYNYYIHFYQSAHVTHHFGCSVFSLELHPIKMCVNGDKFGKQINFLLLRTGACPAINSDKGYLETKTTCMLIYQ